MICALALATIATGAVLSLLGILKAGNLMRFVPVPVVGGFLAGIGCYMIFGGFAVATGISPSLDALHALLRPQAIVKSVCAIAVAGALWFATERLRSAYAIPVVVALSITLFHALGQISGNSIAELTSQGWFPVLGEGSLPWPPIAPGDLSAVRWPIIAGEIFNIMTMMLITAIAVLISISGIELTHERDAEINHELKAAGLASIITGGLGGVAGYHANMPSHVNQKISGINAISGPVAAVICVAVMLFGSDLLNLVPMPLLGGVLLWAGVGLVKRWLVDTYHQLTGGEFAVIILMALVINAVGLVEGLITGLIAGIILFAVDYSRVDIVKTRLTGETFQAKRTLSDDWRNILREHGKSIVILRLQGYIFFGTAYQFVERIRKLVNETEERQLHFLVLDMRRTSGLDASAAASFVKLEQLAEKHRFKLVLTDVPEQVSQVLKQAAVGEGALTPVREFEDLDRGLLWCEEKLIYRIAPALADVSSVSVKDGFGDELFDEQAAQTMLKYMHQLDLEVGDALIEQGTESQDMYFVESGKFAVELRTGDDQKIRLSTAEPGSFVGEISFYLGQERSASVICETPGRVWQFSRDNLDALRKTDPEIASYFHQRMAVMLADRLSATTRLVQHLVD